MLNILHTDTTENNVTVRTTYSTPTCTVSIFNVEQNLLWLSDPTAEGKGEETIDTPIYRYGLNED